jgi:peptidoglycan/xylan/chitin deacetylase (PgdA/CDA1 family)
MTLRSQLSLMRRTILCSLCRRTVPLGDRGPYLSFTFDDFPRTAYTVGGSILKANGLRGTYYTALGLMNIGTEVGLQFSREDLFSLIADGHELASHTLSHISSRSHSCDAFRKDARRGKAAIQEATGISAVANFAYPLGHVTLRAKRALGAEMLSCRSTFSGVNGPEVDLNLLLANRLYGGDEAAPAAYRLIEENIDRRGWLIFYSHDVTPSPSPYGCTPSLLESTVSTALRRGCRVLTVKDVLAKIGALQLAMLAAAQDPADGQQNTAAN